MRFEKLALGLLWAGVWIVPAQVVPDLFIAELSEAPAVRARGERRVREAQEGVRAAMAARLGRRVTVKAATEVVMNALIVESRGGADALAAIPGIRRVWPVHEVHPELDRIAVLHRIREVWEAVGGPDRAGAGMKIGIIDSGLELSHPAFQANGLTPPAGFPRASNTQILAQLNGKVIVYRSYEGMSGFAESAEDRSGHGTAVAMIAAGRRVTGPLGEIQGVAPGAAIGVYKIFAGANGNLSNSAIALKAIDDAAADGMDVLNLSFGFHPQASVETDPLRPAVERAAALGVMLVKSNGNEGPVRRSGSTPTLGSSGLSVGANWTDRVFSSGIRLEGLDSMVAVSGDGPEPPGAITAPLRDVAQWDPAGLACGPLPAGALSGAVALILRGECTFGTKIRVAQAAGAAGAIVYSYAASPNAAGMLTDGAALPAVMISHANGLALKAALAARSGAMVTMAYDDTLPFLLAADGIYDSSSRGPGADGSIRPDLLATGEEILTAAQTVNRSGSFYDPSRFTLAYGTSFAAPIVSGAYAVLKAGRPGLTVGQYRSLLVNAAQPFPANAGRPAPVQAAGAGRLDVAAAFQGRLAVAPVSVSFGLGGERVNAARMIRVQNASPAAGSWKLEVDSADGVKAAVEPAAFSLGPAESIDVTLRLQGDVAAGEYQGFVLLRREGAEAGERPQRVAYWYGVPTGTPAAVTILPAAPANGAAGSEVTVSALITDAIGAGMPLTPPRVSVLEGTGSVAAVSAEEANYPGYWSIRLRLGSVSGETNRYRIEAGPVVREVSIRTR